MLAAVVKDLFHAREEVFLGVTCLQVEPPLIFEELLVLGATDLFGLITRLEDGDSRPHLARQSGLLLLLLFASAGEHVLLQSQSLHILLSLLQLLVLLVQTVSEHLGLGV